MLELKKITKRYQTGNTFVTALKGISISFRKSEFVAILGPSGCGKTTLLNIIGGLDHYTNGDLVINNVSTKQYLDADWDAYRNHSIGFVFQSYNLIPHQTVLANVELALTLSGVSKQERRKRAIEALSKVGLGDQLNKKPNQMSGGQMQRVAIARALVNNPDILLADEPTGALDTSTSVQIMDLLKEVAKDRLVIMVTHNPELADLYANRIIKLLDGKIVSDSNPYNQNDEGKVTDTNFVSTNKKKRNKNKSMSFFTALSLSLNNLLTKKTRTILTAFAGSIGIIGIALILSVSNGVSNYISSVEESTMASYPITISETSVDFSSIMGNYDDKNAPEPSDGYVGSTQMMSSMIESVASMIKQNNLQSFADYIKSDKININDYVTDIVYSYSTDINSYFKKVDESGNSSYLPTYKDYNEILDAAGIKSSNIGANIGSFNSGSSNKNLIWSRLIGNQDYINSQYDVLYGSLPQNNNEVVLAVDKNNRISDYVLYALGIKDIEELQNYKDALEKYKKDPENNPEPTLPESKEYSYEELCQYEYKLLLKSDEYKIAPSKNKAVERTDKEIQEYLKTNGFSVKIVGIVKPSVSAVTTGDMGGILYPQSLMDYLIKANNESELVTLQLSYLAKEGSEKINMKTGLPFTDEYTTDNYDQLKAIISSNDTLKNYIELLGYDIDNPESLVKFANKYLLEKPEDVLKEFGYVDYNSPSGIDIYPKDFSSKDKITNIINEYNRMQTKEEDKIVYSDMVGLILSSVTIIVNAISYVLIAFVSISLIVSSIMIGIITYISVLERTKEIGILRAIGASKRDISRVFNAETLIEGFVAGAMGILLTLLLILPINLILHKLTSISYLNASLPFMGAIILVLISMLLTFIAGVIPSNIAAKKDPVIALRSE